MIEQRRRFPKEFKTEALELLLAPGSPIISLRFGGFLVFFSYESR